MILRLTVTAAAALLAAAALAAALGWYLRADHLADIGDPDDLTIGAAAA